MDRVKEIVKKILFFLGLLGWVRQSYFFKIKNEKNYKIFYQEASAVFVKLVEISKKINIQLWPEYGTLLGIIRDNDFIKGDLDLDVAVFYEDSSREISDILQKEGFVLACQISDNNGKLYLEKYLYNKIPVDIYFYHKKNNRFCTYDLIQNSDFTLHELMRKGKSIDLYRNELTPFELKKIQFRGMDILIPDNTTEHLIELYGSDYKIPNLNYNCHSRENRYIDTFIDYNFTVFEKEYSQ